MITAAKTRKAFETKNQVEFRTGKEPTGWIQNEGKKISRISIPKGNKDIPKGTLQNMAKYLSVSVDQLTDYVECKINGPDLIQIIIANKLKSSE